MSNLPKSFKVSQTGRFAVLDGAACKANDNAVLSPKSHTNQRQGGRANKESTTGSRIETPGQEMTIAGMNVTTVAKAPKKAGVLIGGDFKASDCITVVERRSAMFASLYAEQEALFASQPENAIVITLPNGTVVDGKAYVTTPHSIAKGISNGLADSVLVAKVAYTGVKHGLVTSSGVSSGDVVACDEDEDTVAAANNAAEDSAAGGELWDLQRPLVGDCNLTLLKYDDPEAKVVFSHSSAHILGGALEAAMGSQLTIGPPLAQGFYYDSYMGTNTIADTDLKTLDSKAGELTKKKHPFKRLVLTKDQALDMFQGNPFKVSLITNKVPEGALTTVYACGPLIDLCMGPHVPHTGKIKSFATIKTSSTNWLGQVQNDALQRVYGVAFPDKALLKQYLEFQEKAKQRDHRTVGMKQELFFFHTLSPGSAFYMPHGARVYNGLVKWIRDQYWQRGYQEVITPNVFNLDLWRVSGHAEHYKDNMFVFDVENQEWGMKPMNCPAHCLMFSHRLRSYRELPLRYADFGVLHRNELSGALTGLTRVRRFQQDDAHIFCRPDQIKAEVIGALDFMKFVYNCLGMTYTLELSTRPAKALGEVSVWNEAERQLSEALDEFVQKDPNTVGRGWRINPGDGAFYGPKIDIKVYDALERVHQCATVQLDFQLPIRFQLEYKASASNNDSAAAGEGGETNASFQRPVMIHRAMLGSVERMSAILIEHWGGKWPFWISPRQCMVVPVDPKYVDYAYKVQETIHQAGYFVDVDESSHTLNKKVREAQVAQYNFILVVGAKEEGSNSVTARARMGVANEKKAASKEADSSAPPAADAKPAPNAQGTFMALDELLAHFAELVKKYE